MSSNLTTFFPGAGGGGGGVLKVQEFTSSGTFDVAAAGLSIGDSIIIELVGGGGGGCQYIYNYQQYSPRLIGGNGGHYVNKNFQLTSLTNLTITIGAGGSRGTVYVQGTTGGDTSVYQGATEVETGTGGLGGWMANPSTGQPVRELTFAKGPHNGGTLNYRYAAAEANNTTGASPGVNGLGAGGGVFGYYGGSAPGGYGGTTSNPGCGGCTFDNQATAAWAALSGEGTNGIVKIYYS
jgi:hypothetical protein